MTQTQRERRFEPERVLRSHELSFSAYGFLLSSFATILNLLQKSSPFSPLEGNSVSSELPLIIGLRGVTPALSSNLTLAGPGEVGFGRMKTG